MSELPISEIYRLRDELSEALDAQTWDVVIDRAKLITKLIPKAINQKTCGTGVPHLDGVYAVGMMRLEKGPQDVVRAVRQMNRIIKAAKRTLR